jgi:DNA-binding response OmpR family regulator
MRILVIEDDRKLAELMRRGLTEQGYSVDVAFSAEEGEQLILTIHYDLISLDIMLPDKDGIGVCQFIRQKKADSPILMITAKDTIQDKIKGLDSGADDYLTKPFNFEELYARVRALLRREEKPIANRIEAGDLVMDCAARKVWLAGKEIETKGKEYSVLECLMRHPDAVVSRIMIEQYIRDIRLDTKYNLVDVHICRLRSKIDKKGQDSLIETVRSFGYRLRTK